jgi:hypothetical protein
MGDVAEQSAEKNTANLRDTERERNNRRMQKTAQRGTS